MTQSYNEKAKKQAEINRRAQFASDEKESTDMSTMASQLFLQGKSPDEVYRAGLDRYGERFNLIQPKLGTINQQATLEGMQKGSEIGKTMFPEDAQSFVEQNKSVLSQAHIDGLTRAAENNLASASNQVLAEADKIGGSGGYTGTEVEGQSFRDRIKTLFPRMPASTIDDLQKKASQAAKAANDRYIQQQTQIQGADAVKTAQADYGRNAIAAADLDAKEEDQRQKAITAMASLADQVSLSQARESAVVSGDKKKGIPPVSSDEKVQTQVASYLRSHYVTDIPELVNVLETGSPEKIRDYVAKMETLSSLRGRVEAGAKLAHARFDSPQEFFATAATLNSSPKILEEAGAAYKGFAEISQKNYVGGSAPASLANEGPIIGYRTDEQGNKIPIRNYAASGSARATSGSNNEVANTAYASAEAIKAGLIEHEALKIQTIRSAISLNQTFGVSAQDIAQRDYEAARKSVVSFLKAAGFSETSRSFGDQAEVMTQQILSKAGVAMDVKRHMTNADKAKQAYEDRLKSLQLNPVSAAPYGTPQRLYNPAYAAPHF